MKLNKIMLAAVLSFGALSTAHAAPGGGGTVTFTGSIIDAPCSIAPGSDNQTKDLGQVSKTRLSKSGNTGNSIAVPFEIELQDCDVTTMKTVSVTFTGAPSAYDATKLGLNGTASGASIAIDSGSAPVELGVATKPQSLVNGNNMLAFSAYLVGSGDAAVPPVEGTFSSVATFMLDYV
ncbi:fimbrial protein [Serratia fonticola]|uniref:fimbrial protein n=1 Tax=Serratia fonticola TaxID=47917 RepID=UPI001378161D|nr:fimbrial protein [Serratia fonticola]NBJ34220.1 fimbrial protein [Serratia fonticola]